VGEPITTIPVSQQILVDRGTQGLPTTCPTISPTGATKYAVPIVSTINADTIVIATNDRT
jgi:hypothetical protein